MELVLQSDDDVIHQISFQIKDNSHIVIFNVVYDMACLCSNSVVTWVVALNNRSLTDATPLRLLEP